MDEKSRLDELRTFCLALSTEDCQKIFSASHNPPSKYKAHEIVKSMLKNASDARDFRSFEVDRWRYNDKQFASEEEKLLYIVTKHSGLVLHAFLVAVKEADLPFYMRVEQQIRMAVNRKPCEFDLPEIDYESIDREKLQKDLTNFPEQLLICPSPTCKKIMKHPVLLPCLHSCCRDCSEQFCTECHEYVERSSCQPNYHLHLEIACVASQNSLPHTRSNSEEQRSSKSGKHFIPMCKMHNAQLTMWCNNCEGYRCHVYASHDCNRQNPKHEMLSPQTIAAALKSVLEPFALEDDAIGSAAETSGDAMKSVLDKQFQQTLSVLERNRTRLLEATEHAFTDARQKIFKLQSDQRDVVDRLTKQLNQAYLYVQSIHTEYWHVMDQRRLLFNQLRLLLLVTRKCLPSLTLEQCQSFGFPLDYNAVEANRIVRSLVIRCLDESYDFTPVTRELIGQPDLCSPGDAVSVRQHIAHVSLIETRRLNEYQLRLEDLQQRYTDAVAKIETMKSELQSKKQEAEVSRTEVDVQINKDVIKDHPTKSSGNFGESNGYAQAHCYESEVTCDMSVDSELRSRLRKLIPELSESLKNVNVSTLATHMWSIRDLNSAELDHIMNVEASHDAARTFLMYTYARGDKCIRGLAQALRLIDMRHLADEIVPEDYQKAD